MTALSIAIAAALVAPVRASAPPIHACPIGYLCLRLPFGPVELVAEGDSREFPGGVPVVEATNFTTIGYCVLGVPGYAIGPADSVRTTATVYRVAPGDFCWI